MFLAVLLVAAAAAYVVYSRDDAWLDEHREPEAFDPVALFNAERCAGVSQNEAIRAVAQEAHEVGYRRALINAPGGEGT